MFSPSENTISVIFTIAVVPTAQWADTNKIIPQGVLCFEIDTGNSRIGDGFNTYSNLEYFVNNTFINAINTALANEISRAELAETSISATVGPLIALRTNNQINVVSSINELFGMITTETSRAISNE